MFSKLRKYKKIVFVDCENVGYFGANAIPNNMFVYFFISDPVCIDIIKSSSKNNNFAIINILYAKADGIVIKKNALDFSLLTHCACILHKIPHRTSIVILSNDQDYDIGIYTMKNLFKKHEITQEHCNLYEYCLRNSSSQSNKFIGLATDSECKKFSTKFCEYKRKLKPSQKKSLRIAEYKAPNGVCTYIEHDKINNLYFIVYSGQYLHMAYDKQSLIHLFEQYKNKLFMESTTLKKKVATTKNLFYSVDV